MLTLWSALRRLPREATDTLFLLLVIGWVIAPHTSNLPLWCSLLAVAVLAWRGILAWQSKPLPSKWWLFGLLALTIGLTFFSHRTLLGKEAGVTLIVALLTLKTLELRAKRDAFVVFFLGFFTMLTNFFFSQSMLLAAGMLLGLMGLLTALVHSHRVVGQPPLKESLRMSGFLVLLGAPIMALMFALFPRISPLWGMPSDAQAGGRTGLSSEMRVGDVASLALDDKIAFRLRWDLKPGQQVPAQNEMYFRGPVLSLFDGRTWKPSFQSELAQRYPIVANLRNGSKIYDYEITMEPTGKPWLYLLEAGTQAPKIPDHDVRMVDELLWLSSKPITEMLRYNARSSLDFTHGPEKNVVGMQTYLDLPAGFNPRTLQLAMDIRRDPRLSRATAQELIPEVLGRLRNGSYTYTLEPGVFGQHTADEFWFDKKEGFCEHIASSFVILMRALDVPARVVTGYQGGELNAVDGYWIVRQRDAHAWAEVWQPGVGWVRVDPTGAVSPGRVGSFTRLAAQPTLIGQALSAVVPSGFSQKMRQAFEAINNGWNQWVLNYSQSRQFDLLKNLGFESPSWQDLGKLLAIIIAIAGLIGAAFTLWERHHQDPWLRQLGRARKMLAQAGISSHDASTPRSLAAQALAQLGENARPLHNWLLDLEALRYKPASSAASNLATLARELPRLKPSPQAAGQ